jgi:SNF2 family DNA or RNA helicase
MGNSLRKDIELAVLKLKIKSNNNKDKKNVETLLSMYRKLTEDNKQNISRYIDDAIVIYELMKKIKTFMYKNNISVEDLTLNNIKKIKNIEILKDFDDNDRYYFIERAFLYTKYEKQEDEKGCGMRNTKKNPAFTKDELSYILVDKWKIFNKTTANKKTLAELCSFIDLASFFDFKKTEEKTEEKKDRKSPEKKKEQGNINDITLDNLPNKPCKQRNTKKNPAYTREELVSILSKYKMNFGLNKTQILKLTKDKMCDLLFEKKTEEKKEEKESDENDYLNRLLEDIEKEEGKKYKEFLKGDKLRLNIEKRLKEKREKLYGLISEEEEKDINEGKNFDGDDYVNRLLEDIEKEEGKKYKEFLKGDKLRLNIEKRLKEKREKLYGLIPKKEKEDYEEEDEIKEETNEYKYYDEDDDEDDEEEKKIEINEKITPSIYKEKSIREKLIDMFGEEFIEEVENDERKEMEEMKKEEKETNECYSPINKNIKLKEHQIRVAKHMLKNRGLLAIHGTGTGKTLTAVASMNCILKNFPTMDIIIITPTSLIGNFKKELTKFGLDINSPRLKDRIKFFTFTQFMLTVLKEKSLNICKNKFLIIDEAHNLRNVEEGKMFKAGKKALTLMQCAKHAGKVLLLTATPMKNRVSDILPLISMVDGKDIETIDTTNENELRNTFSCKISIVLPDKQKDENYPKRINVPIDETTFIMPREYYREYYELENSLKEKLDMFQTTQNMFYNLVRRMSLSLDKENSPKVKWTFNFLKNEVQNNRKTVIYTAWKESGVNYIRKLLDKEKIPYGIITGDISAKNRDFYRDLFNRGEIKILIITKAGGEGLDLTETRNVILMEPNWNSSEDEQIIGRAIRYNSHKDLPPNERNVKVYRLMMHKPKELIEEDKEKRGIDQILYALSYEKKEPVIGEFLDMITPYSIENMNCERRNIQRSRNGFSGMSDSDFFELVTKQKKNKEKTKKKQEKYKSQDDGKTFLVDPKEYIKNKKNQFVV